MRETTIYEPLGRKIAARRTRAGLTQQQLADRVGVSRASIANTERGKQTVSVHNLYAICDALGVDHPAELLPARQRKSPLGVVEVKSPDGPMSLSQEASVLKVLDSIQRPTAQRRASE